MKKVSLKIYAKINLSLNILGKQNDMHLLDMVLASVDIYDAISVCLREDNEINVSFSRDDIPRKNNSVTKAIDAIKEKAGSFGADIIVEKNIPLAAGLGGSSADSAGVILILDRLLGLTQRGINLAEIAKRTGSDTVYMLEGGYKHVLGTGDIIQNINSNTVLNLVVAGTDKGCLASQAYKRFDEIYSGFRLEPSNNSELIDSLTSGNLGGIASNNGNALFEPAISLCPDVLETYNSVRLSGASSTFMTGSGSYVVGIFDSLLQAKNAANALRQKGLNAIYCTTKAKGYEFLN